MKVAICGAGLVGSYLFRLLSQAGFKGVTLFDKPAPSRTNCGINPCAWGTSTGFAELIKEIGLDPAKYILQTCDKMIMNGMKVKAKGIIIDKPRLIADLKAGIEVLNVPIQMNKYDRIIDATGFSRAFLPPTGKDIVSNCVQYRVSSEAIREFTVDLSNFGYAWCFPLSGREYHIGAGSIAAPPQKMLEKLGWLKNTSPICHCAGKIRINAPHYSMPLVDMTNHGAPPVWGVGEAIGCVAPLIGEGIIPGLKSAQLLLNHWDDPHAYQQSILSEFSLMKEQRKILDKATQGKRLGLLDGLVLKNSTKRFGLEINYAQGSFLLRSITRLEERSI